MQRTHGGLTPRRSPDSTAGLRRAARLPTLLSLSCQVECLAQAGQRLLPVRVIHDDAEPDLAGVDHADVDAALRQRSEHPPGHAGVRPHADAEDEEIGDVAIGNDLGRWLDRSCNLFASLQRPLQVGQRHAEGQLGSARRQVLHDHVDDDAARRHGLEKREQLPG